MAVKTTTKKMSTKMDYNPNVGYEAFWAEGEWKLFPPTTQKVTTEITFTTTPKTTEAPRICGDNCNYLYKDLGKVCAHHTGYNKTPYYREALYYGLPGYPMDGGWKTFSSYCALLAAQCKVNFTNPKGRYVFVHFGACQKMNTIFKPLFWPSDRQSRVNVYLQDFSKYFSLDTVKPHGKTTTKSGKDKL